MQLDADTVEQREYQHQLLWISAVGIRGRPAPPCDQYHRRALWCPWYCLEIESEAPRTTMDGDIADCCLIGMASAEVAP